MALVRRAASYTSNFTRIATLLYEVSMLLIFLVFLSGLILAAGLQFKENLQSGMRVCRGIIRKILGRFCERAVTFLSYLGRAVLHIVLRRLYFKNDASALVWWNL